MLIRIIAIGKLKEDYWKKALEEYAKRLKPYCRFEVLEGPEEKAPDRISEGEKQQLLAKEGKFFLKHMDGDTYTVALDLKGEMITSEGIASVIEAESMSGKTLQFLIGGSYGIDGEVLNKVDKRIAFGHATFPHQMIRVFMAEQIYRGYKIIRKEPYHK